jgi:hypothetical protein
MDTNEEKLLYKSEVFQIVGCAIEVLNTLGHGLIEKPYENALAVEFGRSLFGSNPSSICFTKNKRSACSYPI